MAETTEFVYIGFIPNLVKLGVFAELTALEGLTGFAVENWHCPFCEDHDGVGASGSQFCSDEAREADVTRTCARRYGS